VGECVEVKVAESQPEREKEGEAEEHADPDTEGEAGGEREDVADDANEVEGRSVSVSECVVEEVGVEQGEELGEYDAGAVTDAPLEEVCVIDTDKEVEEDSVADPVEDRHSEVVGNAVANPVEERQSEGEGESETTSVCVVRTV
jgi:hypothetical protein